MELERPSLGNHAIPMTFDEVSMERSMSFVKALQELKNLRPQLYSAAEYCEKTYLHNEQKQMVLDNLKDYAVRALVNAVDHLGTVAYKLTELIEQQSADVSNAELKVSCLNQRVLTCQTYMDKEGLRQQQLLAVIPRHHKHYILPNSVNKKVHFSPYIQTDLRQHQYQARSLSGNAASKTLSWHLASEAKPTLKGASHAGSVKEDEDISRKTAAVFHLIDNDDSMRPKSSAAHLQQSSGFSTSKALLQTFGATHKEVFDSSKQLTAFGSFDYPNRGQTVRTPVRSKSVLSAFFVKQKAPKLKVGSVM